MIITEVDKQLKDYCSECKEDLKNGERIILTKNLKFFHFFCYKKKNFFYRIFVPFKTFIVWQEMTFIVDELNSTLKKYMQPNDTLNNNNCEETLGSAKFNVHELKISSSKNDIHKLDNDCSEKSEISSDKSSILYDVSSDVSSDEENLAGHEKSIAACNFTNHLVEIMEDVKDMKEKINVFAAEKEHDEKIIKELYSAIIKYKKEIKELRWENNILREKKKKIGRNTI